MTKTIRFCVGLHKMYVNFGDPSIILCTFPSYTSVPLRSPPDRCTPGPGRSPVGTTGRPNSRGTSGTQSLKPGTSISLQLQGAMFGLTFSELPWPGGGGSPNSLSIQAGEGATKVCLD